MTSCPGCSIHIESSLEQRLEILLESNHLTDIVKKGGSWLGYDLGNKQVNIIGGRYWTLKEYEKSSELSFSVLRSPDKFSFAVIAISPGASMCI